MTDIKKLREVAEAALIIEGSATAPIMEHMATFRPYTVLKMLDVIEAAEKAWPHMENGTTAFGLREALEALEAAP